jgi:hypothetical protein
MGCLGWMSLSFQGDGGLRIAVTDGMRARLTIGACVLVMGGAQAQNAASPKFEVAAQCVTVASWIQGAARDAGDRAGGATQSKLDGKCDAGAQLWPRSHAIEWDGR